MHGARRHDWRKRKATAAILGEEVYKRFPWAHFDCGGASAFALPTTTDPVEALLNRTWKPTLSVTGAEGFPALKDAGNVLRPYTAFKLSLRLPPLVDAAQAVQRTQVAARRQRALPGQGHVRKRAAPRPAGTRRTPRRGSSRR